MAVSADKVIVELEAKLDRYNARLAEAERRWNQTTRNVEGSAKRMEESIRRSSGAIGNQLRTLAGTFAAAFSVQQVAQLADTYTRFTNQLRVAGLEGENLARVQQQLFEVAQRNGVEMESLANLYGRVTQSAGDLGATQAEILQLTEGVAAGLRVQGASATQASGAILGLVQALGSAKVLAEEFNQINEGAPALLRAVAQNIDAAGGSISRLRALVVDGKVSNQEFFRAFLAGSQQLQDQAARSTLTIANSFTVLNNALGMYIGQTDDSLSATERISAAIITLSENLDTVATALGVIAAILVGRFAAAMLGAAASTGVASAAIFALQARAAGAATTLQALGFAGAAAGRSLLAAFGGPVGVAVLALGAGIYYLATSTGEAAEASEEYRRQQEALREIQGKTTDATERLATATGRARAEALANARALQQETIQYLANARAALIAARAKAQESVTRLQAERSAARTAPAPAVMGLGGGNFGSPSVAASASANAQAQADLRVALANVRNAEAELRRIQAAIQGPPAIRNVTAASTRGRTRQGPDAEQIEHRFLDDLDRLQTEFLQAQLQITTDAQERAAILRELAGREYEARLRDIEANEDYSEERKRALRADLNRLYGIDAAGNLTTGSPIAEAITRDEMEQAARELLDIRMAQLDAEVAALGQADQLARTQAERREIQNRLLDAEIERLQLELDSLQAWQTHERALAQARLDAARAARGGNQEAIRRDTAGPLERFADSVPRTAAEINEAIEGIAANGLASLNEGIVDAIMGAKSLGDVFKQVANQIIADLLRIAIQKAIVEGISMVFGGGGGLPGFASGGFIPVGGRGGTDNNVLSINGVPRARVSGSETLAVIPQGRTPRFAGGRAAGRGGAMTLQQTIHVDLRNSVVPAGFARMILAEANRNAQQVVGVAAQGILKNVPARMMQFQSDGT